MAPLPRGVVVQGPRPAAPLRYGLLDVVRPVTPSDPHWQVSGVEWEDFLCTGLDTFTDICPPASGFTKTAVEDMFFCHADPFTVLGSYGCPPGGQVRRINEAFEIARQRLLNWESHDVEEVLWTGLVANGTVNPSLQAGNNTCGIETVDLTPGGGPTDPVGAIATLEDALTDVVPNGGVIHVPYGLAAYLAHFDLLQQCDCSEDRYYTPAGNSYILGSGYPGTGPGNVPAAEGTTWIYATGPVGVWRSNVYMVPDNISQAVDREINDLSVFAERVYAVGFSCAVFAINVSLTCTC
jgi:hypothetical protein